MQIHRLEVNLAMFIHRPGNFFVRVPCAHTDRKGTSSRSVIFLLNLFLCVLIVVAYWPVSENQFINYDTQSYVTENPLVNSGVTLDNIFKAFTSTHQSNWHPFTWISHMIDVELFGMRPGPHHQINMLLHVINTLLLFYFLRSATGSVFASALVSALFGLHPLNVESVAWLAERKNVLSSFFWMLTLIAYLHYTQLPSFRRFALVFLVFGLGLMSKPMLVTLPCVLLLLDYWPLGRIGAERLPNRAAWGTAMKLIIEKLPLFGLTIVSCVITFLVQQHYDSVASMNDISLIHRAANAVSSYAAYLKKTIWPDDLAVFYPFRLLSLGETGSYALLILFLSYLSFWHPKKRPWAVVGWLWYIGTLIPVIGLVQVGDQAMADRYAYIPLIGIFIIVAWTLAELVESSPQLKIPVASLVLAAVTALAFTTRMQVGHWQDSITLFRHTLTKTAANPVAHYNLGNALTNSGRLEEAAFHFAQAANFSPNSALIYYGWGANLEEQGRDIEAKEKYELALQLDSDDLYYTHELCVRLGIIHATRGELDFATDYFYRALDVDREHGDAYYNLANVLLDQNRLDEAHKYYLKAMQFDPDNAYIYYGMGLVRIKQNMFGEAKKYFTEASIKGHGDYELQRRIFLIETNGVLPESSQL